MNLKDCKILILDEQGPLFVYFGPDIRQIALTCPDDRQSLIFSSTPTPPSMPPIRMTEAAWSNRYHIRFGAASMLDTLATSKDLQQEVRFFSVEQHKDEYIYNLLDKQWDYAEGCWRSPGSR